MSARKLAVTCPSCGAPTKCERLAVWCSSESCAWERVEVPDARTRGWLGGIPPTWDELSAEDQDRLAAEVIAASAESMPVDDQYDDAVISAIADEQRLNR